jgi:hypothetical protein
VCRLLKLGFELVTCEKCRQINYGGLLEGSYYGTKTCARLYNFPARARTPIPRKHGTESVLKGAARIFFRPDPSLHSTRPPARPLFSACSQSSPSLSSSSLFTVQPPSPTPLDDPLFVMHMVLLAAAAGTVTPRATSTACLAPTSRPVSWIGLHALCTPTASKLKPTLEPLRTAQASTCRST